MRSSLNSKRLSLILLALLLSACTIGVRPGTVSVGVGFGVELSPIITQFRPDRGEGSYYRVGEAVRFVISVNRPGYIALVGVDPDGRAYEFDRFYLNPGTYTLPLASRQIQYTLTYPLGLQQVRAIYTNTPAPASVRFEGRIYSDGFNSRTSSYLQLSGAQVRDVSDTYFYITQ
ncbi:MAG: DUF4384 domain-containing protein [Deinococcota bacterium]|jgi:hypothetical protein|nr:DUF4384 domain-containing protein [Allomeiothermus silvanus]MCL6569738.1 DUF4384 domain-containing protein [Allomeiothermus silvanus]